MNILSIIPARMGSSRFPGKPMAKINGVPMIGHVYQRVSKSQIVSKTVVATCDQEIFDYVKALGGDVVMTSHFHERASDRCAEALQILEREERQRYDIIVMIQGDEPMTHHSMIDAAVSPMLNDEEVQVTNLMAKISSVEEFNDQNCIKVVCDLKSDAIYFSRQPIPSQSIPDISKAMKQVCVIPFRRDFLIKYTSLKPTPLEILESIDMLRVLEHGNKVRMVQTSHATFAVDTPEDLKKVELLINTV